MTIQLKRNDTKDTISYKLTNANGSTVDLTGASVRFIMGRGNVLITNAEAVIADVATGEVEYALTDADTLMAGMFNAEFEVTFSDGKVKTYPNNGYILVNIQPNVDGDKSTYVEDAIALRVSDIEVFKNEVNAKVDQAQADAEKVNDFEDRINNIVAQAGTDNTELVDARLRKDGTVAPTVGSHVRELASQLAEKAEQSDHVNLQTQVNNLVLGAVGDGNNPEVVQARDRYAVLNDRLNAQDNLTTENILENKSFIVGFWNSGGLQSALTGYRVSEPIPIKLNTYYKVKNIHSTVSVVVAYFDVNGNYVTGTPYSSLVNGVFKTPSTASIVTARINYRVDEYLFAYFAECNSDGTLILDGGQKHRALILQSVSKYYGKKANWKGDSIVYGMYTPTGGGAMQRADLRYCELVGKKLGMTLVRNYGTNGVPISSKASSSGQWSVVNTYGDMDNDADLVVIAAGTNDYGNSTPLGSIADLTDVSFYGALNVLCNGLMTKYSGKTIVFITPLHRTTETANTAGFTLAQYRQAIFDVARGKYGLPVIDGYELGFTTANATFKDVYMYDGTHPTVVGHVLLADNVAPKLNAI